MEPAPTIVTITELRKDAARMFDRAAAEGSPVFVTQKGRLTAVVLSRERYDELVALSAVGVGTPVAHTAPFGRTSSGAASSGAASSGAASSGAASSGAASSGVSPVGFPPTRPRHRVDTLYGPVDPETAAFFASEGIWTEDQGGPRPPAPWERERMRQSAEARPDAAADAQPTADERQ